VLLRFWSTEVLMSIEARREWVPPDVAPLALPATERITIEPASGFGLQARGSRSELQPGADT